MGKAISPEFVYPLRTDADIMPNPEHFGIAFVPQKIMWLLFPDYDRTYNSVAFSLAPKANFEYLRERLEVDLDRYGVIDIYPRADQTSHFILLQEIEAITTIVRFFPIITLVTAGFISYIVLKRMVEHQRQQIGVLKAFGYSRRHIMLHYISYSLSLAAAGGMAGGLLGMWLATPITSLLYHFFHLPPVYMGFSWRHLGISMLICFGILGFAGYQGCKAVLRLTPVEAMGPPAPAHGKHSRLEALPLLTSMLTVQGRMALRNLSRSRSRTAFVFFGLMSGCALVAFTWALAFEAMPKFMFYQYEEVQAHDAKVSLGEPRPRQQAIRELERRAEVSRAEPMAEVPVTLRHRWRRENVVLMGILPEARLYNILDVKGRRIRPGDDGLIISERLAYKLGARVGDTLQLESIYLRDPDNEVDVDVVAIVPQYIGMNAYTGISGLERMLRQAPFATSFLVEFGDGPVDDMAFRMRREYRDSDLITGVDTRMEQVRLMTDYWDEVGAVMIIFVAIGVVFSFAIIYVSGIVIFSERRRELASMRVLGMSITEVLGVITFEQWFIAFFAIIAGIPAARLIMRAFARGYSTDMYSMPAEISAGSLLAGVLITALSIWTAQRFAGRWVRRLSLAGALKTPE